ncbi:hypothetical protein ASF12_27025 [Paenibacillus sp. Leaf72]|nr:hypothetical protein ASF12_27025 [Paenibacillus sp. Leaf72]
MIGTEVPLFWLFMRFRAVCGQEIRYRPHYPFKMVIGIAIAAPESANYAITRYSIEIGSSVSTKPIDREYV